MVVFHALRLQKKISMPLVLSQSIPTGYILPGQPTGITSKIALGQDLGSGFDF